MLTKMNRLSVLLYHGEKDDFLNKLRDVGVVHIEQSDKELDAEAAAINSELTEVSKVIYEITHAYKNPSGSCDLPAQEAVKKYVANSARLEAINNEITAIGKEKKRFDPWGDVNFETLDKLKENGVHITLFELSAREKSLLQDIPHEIIKETPSNLWVAAIGANEEIVLEGKEPVHLPTTTLAQLENQESLLNAEKHKLTNEQKDIASQIDILQQYRAKLQDALNFELAGASMEGAASDKLLVVNGWIPESKKAALEKLLDGFSCWYEFSEPTAKDNVPVEFKNSAFAQKYEVITRLFTLPKYSEIDPTPFFAPFYAVFFGFCLGDVGYGALVLIASIIAYVKLAESKMRPLAVLGIMLGFTTILGGFLLNGFFGVPIFTAADMTANDFSLLGNSDLKMYALLKTTAVQTMDGTSKIIMPMIPFALFLGVIQLLFGMVIRILNRLRQNDWNFQYAMYPLGTIFLTIAATLGVTKVNFLDMGSLFEVLFGITAMQVNEAISGNAMLIPLVIGLVLLFLFNNPDKKVFVRLPIGLWELYQFGTGLMGDGLSYIRLFALGLAGGLLGASFNSIAFMICGDNFASPLIIPTILVLIFGHGINFLLACLGSFVHPLRLTFVEFYKHIEFNGGGQEYSPFAKCEA